MSIDPVALRSSDASAPDQEPNRWVVQPGDTLGGIARQLVREGMPGSTSELVRTLVRLNGIADADRIEVGQVLTLPPRAVRSPRGEDRVVDAGTGPQRALLALLRAPEREGLLHGALLRLTRGLTLPVQPGHPRAPDGTPLFRQGDPVWRSERLGVAAEGPTLAHAGCAVTACAMALSRMGDTVVTPDALVRHLRESGGFQGPLVDWSVAGGVLPRAVRASPGGLDCTELDHELDSGRPVLLRVVHDVQGESRQHWICLTARDPRTGQYTANDPATGRTTLLLQKDGGLSSAGGEPIRYASDGRMVRFSTGAAPQA
jgi:hypothetical protein